MRLRDLRELGEAETAEITVTQEDIDRGKRDLGRSCPAALALARAAGQDASDVIVCVRNSYVHYGARWLAFENAPALDAFIIAYDRREPVTPGTFVLTVVRAAR
jgi:hypothetical protein